MVDNDIDHLDFPIPLGLEAKLAVGVVDPEAASLRIEAAHYCDELFGRIPVEFSDGPLYGGKPTVLFTIDGLQFRYRNNLTYNGEFQQILDLKTGVTSWKTIKTIQDLGRAIEDYHDDV